MSLFSSLFKSNTYLGIEIGTTTIKAVEIDRVDKGKGRLANYAILETYGYLERFNNALQTSTSRAMESEISAYLGVLIRQAGIKTKNAIVSLPAFTAFTTLIELPDLDPEEIPQAMQFQAKQFIPMPISTVRIDYFKVGERTDENNNKFHQYFLVSVPLEQVQRYQKIFKDAGLNLKAMEVEGMSLARVLTTGIKTPQLIVDIGARSTSFSVAQNGLLKFQSQTDFAGSSLTQALVSGMNLTPKRAEELKKQKGLLGVGGEYELSTLMLPLLDVIINEADRARENYQRVYNDKIDGVLLAGGGANLPGMEDYFTKQLGLKSTKANPLANVAFPTSLNPLAGDIGTSFAVAIGLALKEI